MPNYYREEKKTETTGGSKERPDWLINEELGVCSLLEWQTQQHRAMSADLGFFRCLLEQIDMFTLSVDNLLARQRGTILVRSHL